MIRFTYKRGLVFVEGQTRWTLDRLLVTNKYLLLSDAGQELALTRQEIDLKWIDGSWLLDQASLASSANANYLVAPRDLSTFTACQQAVALRRQAYLHAVDPARNPYNLEQWKKLIASCAEKTGDKEPPCPASVQNWWRRYRVTKSINALIPKPKGRVRPQACERYEVFLDVIDEVYLKKQKFPKSEVYERVDHRIRAVGVSSKGVALKPPARSTVYRWINELHQQTVDLKRLGAEVTRMKYRSALSSLKVNSINERWELDHTPLDLIVIDEARSVVLGRAWVTFVIDCASRMIVGFYISFNAPSAHGVIQALRCSILPKARWLQRFDDVKGDWPAQGIPTSLAIDNGMDLHASSLEQLCKELGIETQFCGARTPQHKGKIERFMRTVAQGLIHRLPGTTFSNPKDRGDYKSEVESAITLGDLTHLLVKWIVDVYHNKHHRGLSNTPLSRWLELAEKSLIDLPAYPEQLEVICGQSAERTLFHYGIELENLQYNSDQLQSLLRRVGSSHKVKIKFYEDTLAYVYVYDEFAKEYFRVPAKDQKYAENHTRPVHRLIREHARSRFGDSYNVMQLYEAEQELGQIVKGAIGSKKTLERKNAARVLLHDSNAVVEGHNVLAEALKPASSFSKAPPIAPLDSGLDDDLPVLTVYPKEGS